MIENYLLEQFLAVAENGTLLRASDVLHISQPSLSRSMHKIEDEFGVSLFDRSNSKIALNETGKVAADYARRALDANKEMVDHVVAFDRSLRTISIGSCTPFPLNELIPVLTERLSGKTITSEIKTDETLIRGLKSHTYQMVILHHDPEDRELFCQRFMTENLYASLPIGHPLTERDYVTFEDLQDIQFLMDGNIGFWLERTEHHIPEENMLVQRNFDAFASLVDTTDIALFNTDQYIVRGYEPPRRVSVPIDDPDAHATYWLAALTAEQRSYKSVFNAVRGRFLQRE